jgi:hypothetical protein
MIRPFSCVTLLAFAVAACGQAASPSANAAGNAAANATADTSPIGLPTHSFDPPVPKHLPDIVRIRIETSAGTILLALDHKHAPVTTTNFVRYADDHRFDGTSFYRTARNAWAPDQGFIQGGIAHNIRLMLPPIKLEPTSQTGLRHGDGTISMSASSPAWTPVPATSPRTRAMPPSARWWAAWTSSATSSPRRRCRIKASQARISRRRCGSSG